MQIPTEKIFPVILLIENFFLFHFLFSAHVNGGGKSWSVMHFLLQILPKLHFISIPLSEVLAVVTTELLQLWWLSGCSSRVRTRAGAWVFFVSQPVGRGFEHLLHHTFFATSVSRKTSQCLVGVLFVHVPLEITKNRSCSMINLFLFRYTQRTIRHTSFKRFSIQMIRKSVVSQSFRCSDDSSGEILIHDIVTIRQQFSLEAFSSVLFNKFILFYPFKQGPSFQWKYSRS